MFFWIQNGQMTPRSPEISRRLVPPVYHSEKSASSKKIESEEDRSGNRSNFFQDARSAYLESEEKIESFPLLFASQVMSSPVFTISEDQNIEEAKILFMEKRFRHIPILDKNQKLVGVLSDRDLLKTISFSGTIIHTTVKEIMAKKILTGSLQTEIRYAAKVMLDEKVGSLPIVDDNGKILGIITRTDLIRAMVKFPGFTLLA
ncbi:MAG: CBS domain-containing protein [Leptospira sp.]|nr:CBS domain-containing protein [Leptospira sp.]